MRSQSFDIFIIKYLYENDELPIRKCMSFCYKLLYFHLWINIFKNFFIIKKICDGGSFVDRMRYSITYIFAK